MLVKSDIKNEMLCRALEIIQDEEYLDDVDFDEIKRRKRQSLFTEYQSEDKINPEKIFNKLISILA